MDLAVFLEAPSPPAGWVGGFLLSFLGSVLELMSVESQRGLGFGMRIQGLCGVPGWCPKGERTGRAAVQALGLVSPEGSGTSLCLSQGGCSLLSLHLVR